MRETYVAEHGVRLDLMHDQSRECEDRETREPKQNLHGAAQLCRDVQVLNEAIVLGIRARAIAVAEVEVPGRHRLAEAGNAQDKEEAGHGEGAKANHGLELLPRLREDVEEADADLDLGEEERYTGEALEEGPRYTGADGGGVECLGVEAVAV